MSRKPRKGYYVRGQFVAEGSELDEELRREQLADGPSKTELKAQSAELTWSLLDPDPGFFDADDSVCNVFSIWKGLENERQEQQVPLKTLAGTEPFTLTFDGDVQYTADQQGQPASIAYSWKYSMTLQRVDEQGKSL